MENKMDYVSDAYYKKLTEAYAEVKHTYSKLVMMLSSLDKKISEIYHQVEKSEYEELDAIACVFQLKEVLARRRAVKDELARLKPMRDMADMIERRYEGALKASFQVRQELNLKMSLDQVCAEMGVNDLLVTEGLR
jgi:hypothetical protein